MAFSVLTAAQGARLRNRIGDISSAEPKLSDTVLDAIYTDTGLDLNCATVAALEELIGIYAMQVDIPSGQETGELRHQRVMELRNSLQYWTVRCTTAGAVLSTGTLDYNLDTDYDDLDVI